VPLWYGVGKILVWYGLVMGMAHGMLRYYMVRLEKVHCNTVKVLPFLTFLCQNPWCAVPMMQIVYGTKKCR
jgi:hypothetical protein